MPTERIAPANARVRNQAMECFKMVAAIFVVFLHVSFPSSKAQGLMFVLANDAVLCSLLLPVTLISAQTVRHWSAG